MQIHISRAKDLSQIMGWQHGRGYYVVCFDAHDGSWYSALDLEGPEAVPAYATEEEAKEAARRCIDEFSNGEYGRQEVFIVHPDGMMILFWLAD